MYRLTVVVDIPNGGMATYRFQGNFLEMMWDVYYAHRHMDPFFDSVADKGRFATDYVNPKTGKVENVA